MSTTLVLEKSLQNAITVSDLAATMCHMHCRLSSGWPGRAGGVGLAVDVADPESRFGCLRDTRLAEARGPTTTV